MKKTLTLFFCCFFSYVHAQIIAPDTVCAGTPVLFSTNDTATSYTWDFDTVSVAQTPSAYAPVYTIGSNPTFMSFNKDGANNYLFVSNYFVNQLKRLDFGSSFPGGTPVVYNLGSCGITATSFEGIDVVKDPVSGNWFGLLAASGQVSVLSFGASLSSTPTYTMYSIPTMSWVHQVKLIRYNGEWIAFLADRNSTIKRLYFGASLSTPPTSIVIPNTGSVNSPCNFSVYEQGGNWYMLVTSLSPAGLTRYNFGPSLMNPAPTGTLLPSPAGMLYLPRCINLVSDCPGHLIGYILNETGHNIKVDFGGDITSMPTFTDLGASGITTQNGMIPCTYNDTVSFLTVSFTGGGIWRFQPFALTSPAVTNYYTPSQSHTFTTPGTYNVTLLEDVGSPSGPSASCKPIVVVGGPAAIVGSATVNALASTTFTNAISGGTWTSSTPGVATVGSATGVVTGVMPGTAIITYSLGSSGCGDTTKMITVVNGKGDSTVNVSLAADARFSAQPNPSSGLLNIEAAAPGTFAVYALDGRLLCSYRIKEKTTSVSLPNSMSAGLYICRFYSDGGSSELLKLVYAPR